MLMFIGLIVMWVWMFYLAYDYYWTSQDSKHPRVNDKSTITVTPVKYTAKEWRRITAERNGWDIS
jgi:hypothetical protein